jgi:putative sigma-54 modulation protein
MEAQDRDFFVFANSASGEVNVIYRRRDGNIGLIEAHASSLK